MGGVHPEADPLLPEWGETELDEAALVAALEAARRAQFAELADL